MVKKFEPDIAIADLKLLMNQCNLSLSPEVETVFHRAECLALEHRQILHSNHYLIAAIEIIKPFRAAIIRQGGDPNKGSIDVLKTLTKGYNDPYDLVNGRPYSTKKYRGIATRTILIDLAISSAHRNRHSEITMADFLEALFDFQDQITPIHENGSWPDKALRTPYSTLSHFIGKYRSSLWVRVDGLRRELGLLNGSSPVEFAPPEVRTAVMELFEDYPNYDKNCFIIMPFRNTSVHLEIYEVIGDTLGKLGFNALRADMKSYSDDLFINILSYLHGCKFGIAVFERVLSEDFNPNVSLEVGYLLGMRKPVLLLKDQTLPRLPSDLVGRLYTEFNTLNIKETLPKGIKSWLLNKQLIRDKNTSVKLM